MKIAIDARPLTEPITGIGRYSLEVISRLVEKPHQWFLYSHRPLYENYFKGHDNVTIRHLNIQRQISRQLWAQSVLPLWAAQNKADLFWCPAHRIPELLPRSMPALVTIHDLVWQHAGETMRPLSRFLDSHLMPRAIERANRILTVSQSTARDIVKLNPRAHDKIQITPLAGNFEFSGTTTKSNPPARYFLFVGTLEPRKNLDRILQAYASLDEGLKKSCPLVIVGGRGWGGVNAADLVGKYHLTPYVHIKGRLEDNELMSTYQHAYALLLPSLYEGFGIPILEAMQFGVPVITSNCSSMPEAAGNGGLLVDPTDSNAIAQAMRHMLVEPMLREMLSAKAQAHAQLFSWEKTAENTYQVIMDMLDGTR